MSDPLPMTSPMQKKPTISAPINSLTAASFVVLVRKRPVAIEEATSPSPLATCVNSAGERWRQLGLGVVAEDRKTRTRVRDNPLNKSHFDELFLSGSSDQCFLVSKTKELFLFLSVYNKGIKALNKIYYPTIANADKILQLSWPMSITTFHHLSQ